MLLLAQCRREYNILQDNNTIIFNSFANRAVLLQEIETCYTFSRVNNERGPMQMFINLMCRNNYRPRAQEQSFMQ